MGHVPPPEGGCGDAWLTADCVFGTDFNGRGMNDCQEISPTTSSCWICATVGLVPECPSTDTCSHGGHSCVTCDAGTAYGFECSGRTGRWVASGTIGTCVK
jgi:hypothetical protein